MTVSPHYILALPWIGAPSIGVDLLWTLSYVFMGMLFLYLFSVFVFRTKLAKKQKRNRKKKKALSPMIGAFLFHDANGSKKEKLEYIDLKIQVRELIKCRLDRQVLISLLLDLQKDVSGEARNGLLRLYQDLELHRDAYTKLRSWRWETISKGIFELTQMEVVEAYGHLARFLNDRRSVIRKQAELAVVALKDEGICHFLDTTQCRISEWQQLKLTETLKHKTHFVPPAFRLWLTSHNNDVVLFSLRLIKHYQQSDAIASITRLVEHRNHKIKQEALICLRDFNAVSAVATLKALYHKNTEAIKMFFLDAFAHLGTEEDIPFLTEIGQGNASFTIKNKAIMAINTIRPEGVLPSKDIDSGPTEKEYAHTRTDNTAGKETTPTPKPQNPTPSSTEREPKTSLENIPVWYDLVQGEEADAVVAPQTAPWPHHVTDGSFLPVVVDKEMEDTSPSKVPQPPEEDGKMDLSLAFLPLVVEEGVETLPRDTNEIKVCFEMVAPTTILPDPKEKDESPERPNIKAMKEEHTEGVAALHELEVIFESLSIEVPKHETASEQEISIDWNTAFSEPQQGEVTAEKDRFGGGQSGLNTTESLCGHGPKWNLSASFCDGDTMDKMVLLQHLAELGDAREIPYLESLKAGEESVLVLQRLEELIERFSIEKESSGFYQVAQFREVDSVFHEILQHCDEESKILLVQEMGKVGDAKELPLLNQLMAEGSQSVAHMAKVAYNNIVGRLKISEETARAIVQKGKSPKASGQSATKKKKVGALQKEPGSGLSAVSYDGMTQFDQLTRYSYKPKSGQDGQ
ncbi:HEAT repeat domain-containing protein [Maribacter sp. 2307ULW6-5]|uniref:HEAT repeat domain-containing protein n=1 Tax=Maribacter sp. 2307ULW6-5 TaxID=3386275 RepID=UPI0039BCF16C